MQPLTVRHSLQIALLSGLLAHPAFSATFSLNPAADAFVTTGPSGNLSNSNYGGAGALSVAAPGLAQGEFQSVLQFDLSGMKNSFDSLFGAGQWTVQSVSLQLTAASPNNPIFNASSAGQFGISWMQNDNWLEGTGGPLSPSATGITFSTLSSLIGPSDESLGIFSFNGATSGSLTYSLDRTPSFSTDIQSGSTLSLRMFAADNLVSFLSDSRNFGTTSARPLLTITAVPEPGVLSLMSLCLPLLIWRKQRQRRLFP